MTGLTPALPANRPAMTGREWLLLIALSVVWGGSFLFNAVAVREWPPMSIVLVRVGLGAAILYGVMRGAGIALPRAPKVLAAFLLMGAFNCAAPFVLIVWSQTQISAGLASILNATTPLFTVLVTHFAVADERLTPARLAGVGCGIAGVAVLIGLDALSGLGANLPAQIASLAAAASYALSTVYGRRFRAWGVPPLAVATGQLAAATLVLAPLALLVDRPWLLPPPSLPAAASLLALASVSTAAAYVVYFRLLASAGPTNLALVTFLVPVSAIALGIAVLGETLLPQHLAGMLLIGCGLALIDGRLPRRLGF